MVKLSFKIPPDAPLAYIAREFPEAVFSILATQDLPRNRILTHLDVFGPLPEDFLDAARRAPGVMSVSSLGSRKPQTRLQVVSQRPSYLALASRLEALLRYPRIVHRGRYLVEVVARVFQLRELIGELRRISPDVEVMRFGPDPMRTFPPTLTAGQQALLHQALAAEYFDVPRRITLTRLARTLDRSKSALSESLARIERELVEASVIPNA